MPTPVGHKVVRVRDVSPERHCVLALVSLSFVYVDVSVALLVIYRPGPCETNHFADDDNTIRQNRNIT